VELAGLAILSAWVAAWIWLGRYALLDDALIHLRFAHLLLRTGFLSFDGVTPSYGSSSPLFVGLLAVLAALDRGPLLPKLVSVVFYLLLLAITCVRASRSARHRPLWLLLVVTLGSPMALRWLTDGMETSLTAALAAVLALVALERNPGRSNPLWLLGFGAVLALTRIELCLGIFFAVLGAAPLLPVRHLARRHLPLALGGLASLALLVALFGHVLPDTALAKQAAPSTYAEAAMQVGRSSAASLTLGLGLALLWLATLLWGLLKSEPRGRSALALCNLLLPCTIAIIARRGQILHGVRYLIWIYVFLIFWNLRLLDHPGDDTSESPTTRTQPRRYRALAGIAAAAILLAWVFEAPAVARILDQRNRMFLAMRSEHLERLKATTGAGFDIGFIAFFTQGRILDFSGLVNGRRLAALSSEERLRVLAAAQPEFLYVTAEQASSLARSLDLNSYRISYRYLAATLTQKQEYFLALRGDRQRLLGAAPGPPLATAAARSFSR
jgi:hypothetical protein